MLNKKRLFVYTDSRGFNVISKLGKTPFGTYIDRLGLYYRTDFSICPQKFTTIFDFLQFFTIKKKWEDYDFVILHCGVVDFSPRPYSNIKKVEESKIGNSYFNKLFEVNATHQNTPLGIKYYDEDVSTLYSIEYLENEIGPQLAKIKNLIWIDSNHFVKGWDGNFTKKRPANIEESVSKYDEVLSKFVKNRISLKDWTIDQIKVYTIDNIHFTDAGFKEVFNRVKILLNKIDNNKGH